MTIQRGTRTIKRQHAKNYIGEHANTRFSECVKPYQEQGLNALKVDYFPILLYQRAESTTVCTCKETEEPLRATFSPSSLTLPSNVINPISDSDAEIVIDYARPLFGDRYESSNNTDYSSHTDFVSDDLDIDEEYLEDEVPSRTTENLFSANAECALCYRTGFVPGYTLYGWDRQVLCAVNATSLEGVTINQSKTPHAFEAVDKDYYVEFLLNVPRYFKAVRWSCRNNTSLTDATLLGDDTPLTVSWLRSHAGTTIPIKVSSETFTHCVIEFDLGIELRANIAQMSKSLDWTSFDTLGNLNLILPMTIPEVRSSDLIYIPRRDMVLKVTDTPYLRTALGENLDWSVNTRVCQPQESVKRIRLGKFLT